MEPKTTAIEAKITTTFNANNVPTYPSQSKDNLDKTWCNGQNCLAIKDAKFDANTNTCICMASGSTHNPKKLGFS
ncbi:hypothetical protein DPMN_188444 [Dreissena polymorpha]|uniref:Uncharacterized protein n=1 Tax=Dreissena polymorpha TaxID=45954 RepID=A0A9D4DQT1_DREPO|nr:hypothetical protein DPMN_188444 [Dreissena polymorpha]